VARYVGAERHERTPERRDLRNGTKPRTMKTAVGELHFDVPQVRSGGFHPTVFERYQRSDKALVAALQEMVVCGVSTRQVSSVLEELGGFEVSSATVSRAMADLDEELKAFRQRDVSPCEYPYVVVDARYEKVRKNGRVVTMAVLIVTGINDEGRREILGYYLGDSESEASWGEVFGDLKRRGLKGVVQVTSDAHKGLRAALAKHFQGVSWQRCRVHLMREMFKKVSWKDFKELAGDLRSIYVSEEKEQCLRVAEEVAQKWEPRAPKVTRALREGVEDTLAVLDLPARHRKRLHSTNMVERLNRSLKTRTRKVCIFPNESACLRLVGALLLEIHETWAAEDRRYLVMEED